MTTLLWLRQDLRLHDQPALFAAIGEGDVVPVYIFDESAQMGAAQRWWLHHSLTSLKADLAKLGADLILRRGHSASVLIALLAETGATRPRSLLLRRQRLRSHRGGREDELPLLAQQRQPEQAAFHHTGQQLPRRDAGRGSGALAARESGRFGGSDLSIKLKREPGPKAA